MLSIFGSQNKSQDGRVRVALPQNNQLCSHSLALGGTPLHMQISIGQLRWVPINPWSQGGMFMVQKMTITSPIPGF